MRSFADDLQASLAHLKLPVVHRKHIRTTNLVERSFEEERRRAKVIPRFRGEKASGERGHRGMTQTFSFTEKMGLDRWTTGDARIMWKRSGAVPHPPRM
jgi:transposase-like protein